MTAKTEQAFPTYLGNRENWDLGMTLRDYLAAQAMPTMMSVTAKSEFGDVESWSHIVAKGSYLFADAMLEARKS